MSGFLQWVIRFASDGRAVVRPLADCARDRSIRPGQIGWLAGLLALGWMTSPITLGQVPPPQLGPSESADLVAQRSTILRAEADQRLALKLPPVRSTPATVPDDGATRFVPLPEVVTAAEIEAAIAGPPDEQKLRRAIAERFFDLAMSAAKTPSPPLAFVDDCLRSTLARLPDHAEARRLLGFIPHAGKGWATPYAARELSWNKVKDPTFGWVPADWVPHLRRGELPAPRGSREWLAEAEADALRRDWRSGWDIATEHFQIHTNVPLSGAIAFGRQLETLHEVFFALMADLIGANDLPLAKLLRSPGQPPNLPDRPRRQVYYFATHDEYVRYLTPIRGEDKQSLGIYLPRSEYRQHGGISYFFNDKGGQLDASATLHHEASHQLLFESAGPDDYNRNRGNFWVFEGLGTYFETLEPQPDGSIRIGGLVGPRIAAAHQRIIDQEDFVPLESFVKLDRAGFVGDRGGDIYLHYAEAMAFAVFLMQANQTRYREPFLDYARDAYRGQLRNGNGRPLDDRLDRPYPDLQREFFAYLARYQPPGH